MNRRQWGIITCIIFAGIFPSAAWFIMQLPWENWPSFSYLKNIIVVGFYVAEFIDIVILVRLAIGRKF